MTGPRRRVVVGIGNEYRRDDGFGPLVIAELAALRSTDPALRDVELCVSDGEPAGLLMTWTGAAIAVVVDAVRVAGEPPGLRHEMRLDAGGTVTAHPAATSHAVDFGDTVALGRVLGRLPGRLVVLAVCGTDFRFGTRPGPEVAAAVRPVALRARELVAGP
ncbi:peptidase M52 [Actinoplanes sp. NBRC 14428]|uniref:Hydrogenase maturation protease n=1 Tax=Pseudosporangium ferrugineum TaxID=439699 RepID=A0A2T0RKG5_9ACTN|nr:hydrogenase maturation protease [Pseudosporangium ferrugineum]PRY21610.1 hydrogenase maturation protease [Pseudosporangium ferrugineum]BCJ49314.1 peptidase M52 [Actinoplanes sp. NBRC 14428]